jgi:surface antigen
LVHKTSSKINLPNEAVAQNSRASKKHDNTLALRQAYQQTVAMHKSAGRLIRNPRAYVHLAVLGSAMAIVFGSNLVSAATRTQAVSQLSTANGLVATLDPITSSEVAVTVAIDTKLPVDTSLALKSSNVADQSVVGDENALAKQEVMSISQSIRRTISTHKVEAGDTLEKLGKEYNITTDTIKWANNLNGEPTVGQELKILPVSGVSYTVQAGDTVEAVAAKFKGDVNAVREFNDIDVKGLAAGTEVIIPDGSPVSAAPAVARRSTTASYGSGSNSYYGGRSGGSFANTYTRGQCTWYVASRRQVPNNWGNAVTWLFRARAAGYATGDQPRAGAVGWEKRSYSRLGHVVYVESVNADGSVNISEMNWGGRPGVVHYRTMPASAFVYIY